jgi:hypothetical protein
MEAVFGDGGVGERGVEGSEVSMAVGAYLLLCL